MLWAHVLTSLVSNIISVAIVIGVALLMGFNPLDGPQFVNMSNAYDAALSHVEAGLGLLPAEAADGSYDLVRCSARACCLRGHRQSP